LAESEKDNRASPRQLFIHHFSAFQRNGMRQRHVDKNRYFSGKENNGGRLGGAVQDLPAPTDYDVDAKTDIGIYRDRVWSIKRSSDAGNTLVGWGEYLRIFHLSAQQEIVAQGMGCFP
jgi:hypothetical protein